MSTLEDISGIGPALRRGLASLGITDTAALARADVAMITQIRGISTARAETFIDAAKILAALPDPEPDAPAQKKTRRKSPDSTAKSKKKKAAKPKTKEKKSGKSGKDKKAKAAKKGGKKKKG